MFLNRTAFNDFNMHLRIPSVSERYADAACLHVHIIGSSYTLDLESNSLEIKRPGYVPGFLSFGVHETILTPIIPECFMQSFYIIY